MQKNALLCRAKVINRQNFLCFAIGKIYQMIYNLENAKGGRV